MDFADHLPRRLGRYELLERIAAGGMAELYRGRLIGASGFERIVAVKCIRRDFAHDEDFVRMFVDEARIAVQLSHPNIAQVIELGREGDVYFIAQEFVHGRDLRAVWKAERARGGRIPLPVTLYIARSICEALHYAHGAEAVGGGRLGLVHRDISPQNVLLSYEGEVKVVDFGLARAKGRLTQTATGVVKGKLAYLSPEQAFGRPVDHRADLYALGIVLWELVTGERLFWRPNDVETVRAVRRGEVPSMRRHAPDVPVALEHIVARALRREPQERFHDAGEMLEALEALSVSSGWMVGRRQASSYLRALLPPPPRRSHPPVQAAEPPTALQRPRSAAPPHGAPPHEAQEPPTRWARPGARGEPPAEALQPAPGQVTRRVSEADLRREAERARAEAGGEPPLARPEPLLTTLRMEVPSELVARTRAEVTEEVSLREVDEVGSSPPGLGQPPTRDEQEPASPPTGGARGEMAATILDVDLPEAVRAAAMRWQAGLAEAEAPAGGRSPDEAPPPDEPGEADEADEAPPPDATVEDVLGEGMVTVPGVTLEEVSLAAAAADEAEAEGPDEQDEPPTDPHLHPPIAAHGEEPATEPRPAPRAMPSPSSPQPGGRRSGMPLRSRSLVLGGGRRSGRAEGGELPKGRVIRVDDE